MFEQILKDAQAVAKPIAAFDADGTLWSNDLGESLFDYQIRHKLVGLPKDPWAHYENMKSEISHEAAYLWLAQINNGIPVQQIRQWAAQAVDEMSPVPVFPEVQKLISELHAAGVEVYVVTASIKWAVEPGAALFNIPPERVIGIQTEIVDGKVTEKQLGPITYRDGKVTGLTRATGGALPFFCAGNTEGDLPLLESSTSHRLVIGSAPPQHKNFATERKMIALAKERGWPVLDYL